MRNVLLLLATGCCAAGAACAGQLNFEAALGPDLTDWSPARTLAVQQFDPSLGTLSRVTLDFFGTLQTRFIASNPTDEAQSISNTLDGSMSFSAPGAAMQVLSFSGSDSAVVAAQGEYDSTLTDSRSATAVLASGWSELLGTGTFDVAIQTLGASMMTGSGNFDSGAFTLATARVSVTYDYTSRTISSLNRIGSIPEPASLALVGVALAAASLARRRPGARPPH